MKLRILSLIATLLFTTGAGAVTTRRWTVSSQQEWLEGEAEGVMVTAAGELTTAPRLELRALVEESIVWSIAAGRDGGAWVGTGTGGELLWVDRDGEVSVAATFDELQVTALLGDGRGVIAATAPDGAIYQVRRGEEPIELARPEATYIWALARDADGRVVAATGVDGIIYVLADDGEVETLYDAPDVHVASLLSGGSDGLVAGTAERGLVLAIDEGGHARVLYDSEFREVRALARDGDGVLYAAINGGPSVRAPGTGPQPAAQATVTVSASAGSDAQAQPVPARPALSLAPPEALGDVAAEIVRIDDHGVEVMARIRGELIHALALAPGGELYAGTTKRLLLPEGGDRTSVVALGEPGQVSGVVLDGDRLLVATSGPSRLYVGAHAATSGLPGRYTSRVLDAGARASWGSLRRDVAGQPSLDYATRSGDSLEPDETWDAWRDLGDDGSIASPPAQYLQWRVDDSSSGRGDAVRSVTVSFQPVNSRPVIESFQVHPPGMVYARAAAPPNVVEVKPPPIPGMFDELAPAQAEQPPGKPSYRPGAQSLSWKVSDPDDDRVRVKLAVRGRDHGPWLQVTERAAGTSFAFDTGVLPDGWYVARLEADDGPSNPAGQALSVRREGEPFLVDNTPPEVVVVDRRVRRGKARVRFEASDRLSTLWKGEWSLDGQPFRPLRPTDGLTDEESEVYEIETEELTEGEHLIVLRVHDMSARNAVADAWIEVR